MPLYLLCVDRDFLLVPTNSADFLITVHDRLCVEYHAPIRYFGNRDPLSQLVSSFLSQRTTNKNKSIAYKALVAALPTWDRVRDAPVDQLQELIRVVTWPERKAPGIQAMLRAVKERAGDLSLDFLRETSVDAARAWLLALPGVGPKTANAVLCFSELRMKAMPVDAHHYRVAMRLGMIAPSVSEAKAHDLLAARLPKGWSAQDYYDHHEVMMFHGQKCCFFKTPACARCVLRDICPTGRLRLTEDSLLAP